MLSGIGVGALNFLCTAQGQPLTAAGFGNWFRDACNAAGLNNCSAHGLRKAAARRLAERNVLTVLAQLEEREH